MMAFPIFVRCISWILELNMEKLTIFIYKQKLENKKKELDW